MELRASAKAHACSAFGKFLVEQALIEFGDGLTLKLVTFVEEGQAESIADIPKDFSVLRPCNDGPRRHYRRKIAVHEGRPRQIGHGDHLFDGLAALVGIVMRIFRQNDLGLGVDAQVVQGRDQRPAVHLTLVDLLRTMIQPRRIAQAHGVGGGKDAEIGVGFDHLVLVQQGQFAVDLQHALDHEHHIGAAGIVFIEYDRGRVAQRPRQDAFLEIGDLLAIFELQG